MLLEQIADRLAQHVLCWALLFQRHHSELLMDSGIHPHREGFQAAAAGWTMCLGLGLWCRRGGLGRRGERILE